MKEQKVIRLKSSREGFNAIRCVTVIGETPYYMSSGYNSSLPNTWFPFGGVNNELKKGSNTGLS